MQGCLVQWVRSAKTPSGFPADRRGARADVAWRVRRGVGVMHVRRYVSARGGKAGGGERGRGNAIAPTRSSRFFGGVCGSTWRTRTA